MGLIWVVKLGYQQEKIERIFPTPPDFTLYSRWLLRSARALQNPQSIGLALTSWSKVGEFYTELLERLENPEIDGKGLKEQTEGGLVVDGVGKIGYDIEGMSESWKMGYFQALMGAAETAEKLEGWMYDEKLDAAAPAEYVVGPSNPNPKPKPASIKHMLNEEDSRPAYESPEVFYMKILTTKGFQTNQRLDAALAYADWLDFKGWNETADDMYRWAMDIAASGLPVDPSAVVDMKTGILKDVGNKHVTENILRATTALGVHKVRRGDLAPALSIFLSVLRARRNLPEAPISHENQIPPQDESPLSELFEILSSYVVPPPYPYATLTGNERPLRSASEACDEAGLMVYIGEIIFASSSQENGLSWTRDAVDLAEISLLRLDGTDNGPRSYGMKYSNDDEKCHDCLRTGLDNWKKMVKKLVVQAEQEELDCISTAKDGWFSSRSKQVKEKQMQRRRWEAEEMIIEDRSKRIQKFIGDPLLAGLAPNTTMMLFS
ncbi:predicted protein [Uncinocarpus reesii 1704]|uniref:Uncharacterized protein n=1 Tax=Uncinocarpus reesii (strain UAMH 1704) TaxID=336963 RepID=C4JE73_UNCRE|nr:uncharacterized protein UREG_00497 [Uncinocarpus reesii 1704]EEP75651.1 predicted protein [Uncinocarpus reesii 1704]